MYAKQFKSKQKIKIEEPTQEKLDELFYKIKNRGFITEKEIFYVFPYMEHYIDLVEDFLEKIEIVGIKIVDNSGGMLQKKEANNKIFSEIWIAKKGAPNQVPSRSVGGLREGVYPKRALEPASRPRDIPKEKSTRGKKRGQIEYDDFAEKDGKKYNKA